MLDKKNFQINLKVQFDEWEKEIKSLTSKLKNASQKDKAKLQKQIESIKKHIHDGKEKLKKLTAKS